MRKCSTCGSLLLGEVDACGRCGAPLPVVNATAAPAAPAWGAPPAAPPAWGAPPPPPPSGPPAGPPPSPFGRLSYPPPPPVTTQTGAALPPLRESWQPVSVTAPPAPARSKGVGAIALAVVVALVVGVGVMHFRSSDSLPSGTSAFAAGKGVVFTSPDGVYRAQFPQAVTTELAPATGNGLVLRRAYAKTDSYEIVAASSVAPAPIPAASVNVLLEAGLAAEIANLNGKLQNKKETTFAGMPAIEGSFKGPDGYSARILVVASGADIFEVVVHAKTGTEKLFSAFESSLIIY